MSDMLENFKRAVQLRNWKAAYKYCNGLNMYEMLRGLDSFDPKYLNDMRSQMATETVWGGPNMPRIEYAMDVVQFWKLREGAPGDLQATGQVQDAINFLAERKKIKRIGPRLGNNGPIPVQYISIVRQAINIAWSLNEKPDFIEKFRDTVSTLSGRIFKPDIYAITLNKMVINLAETSTEVRIAKAIADEISDIKAGNLGGPTPAFSFMNGTNIWIRKFSLAQGVRAVVPHIFHEGAHLAGAPGNPVAEFALDGIHEKAGFPR